MLRHDPGFISGFIGVSIDVAVHQIWQHVRIALRCREELNSLRDLVMRIKPIIDQIQQYRLALNMKRGIPIFQRDINMKASAVNDWLKRLNSLLQKASTMAQECTIPSYDCISRYRTSRRIIRLNTQITHFLESDTQMVSWLSVLEELGNIKESIEALAPSSSATTSATTSEPVTSKGIIINEPNIVGQRSALERLEELVTDAESDAQIGVLGKGGSGKTLLMKTLFNSQKVRNLFRDCFLLWLTISASPSIPSLSKELFTQISMQRKVIDPNTNMNEEAITIGPLNEALQGKRFALFLDDVWEKGAELLENLGVLCLDQLPDSKIIVSSRNSRVLSQMGVAEGSKITVGDLVEKDSWELFRYYAFPYNKGNVAVGINEETAKVVCHKCGGLPLAIKAVGRAMAGITDANEWGFAVQRLPDEQSKGDEAVYDRLRLSYDALASNGVYLQLAFLYLGAAFLEDEVVQVEALAILLWMGEGLLGKKKVEEEGGHDPFEMGRMYVNILADRCLIEPIIKDVDGRIVCFRMHDVLRGMAIHIAEEEENFYSRAGRGLTAVNENAFAARTRIVLEDNKLASLSQSLRAPEICSLLLARNHFTEIPKKVIGSMISLKVLDLTATDIQSLPESVGCLKQLVCLKLAGVPIKRLPASFTNLAALQILELESSKITELPSDLHKLRSLRYLNLDFCNDLKCVPSSISSLTSLQRLYISDCKNMTWTTGEPRSQKAASVNSLCSLTQLKSLHLDNYGAAISDGTLGSMVDLEAFELGLTQMPTLPHGIFNISKLRKLNLDCPDMVSRESKFHEFQNLTLLRLWNCLKLEELPDLHQLKSLKRLDIVNCTKLKRFPKEFGERGAFPLLEQFGMVELEALEELPIIEEGGMPSLKIVTIMLCETIKMFPECYLNIRELQKLRVYGCSKIVENLGTLEEKNTEIKIITLSTIETENIKYQYLKVRDTLSRWLYSEFSSSEIFPFLRNLHLPV